jgi:hypothetical protein
MWAHFGQLKFNSESLDYFKIRGELEELLIAKSVPNWIFYLHKISRIFIPFLTIFPMKETFLGFV